MHKIYLEKAAEKDLKGLEAEDFHRIISLIKKLANDPRPPGCRKLSGTKNDWRIRSGDYRILYEIDDKEKVIRVFRIRHRGKVYR